MTNQSNAAVTPHRYSVDLNPLEGHEVFGESLAILFSFALRIKFERSGRGMAAFSGTWPMHEADALMRAMERVEPDTVGDQRSEEQRNADRLVAVLSEVATAAGAVLGRLPEPS